MRRFSWIITLPILVAAILFAITNREMATLTVWPWVISLPTYLLILGCLLLGFLFGTVVAWFSGGERRRRVRRLRERVQAQARQLAELRRELASTLSRSTAGSAARSASVVGNTAVALSFPGAPSTEAVRRPASD